MWSVNPKKRLYIDENIYTNKRTRERPFKQCGANAPRTWRRGTTLQNERTLLYFCFNHIISIFFTLYSKVHLNILKK